MISKQSRLRDVYNTPVGHDVLQKLMLQLNIPNNAVTRAVMSALRLKTIERFAGSGITDAIIALANSVETILPRETERPITPAWWKEAVFYQIYPRSFKDSDGDGVGDVAGIAEKLDYLQALGVDCLWLSPIYDSPNKDNGYDIRDYYRLMTQMGTMAEFDALLTEVHNRGMKLIMDLVINHTSDEHHWYQQAITSRDSPYYPYYIFRDGKNGSPPNNWVSFFSGEAWRYEPSLDQWALHLFSPEQPDLNWRHKPLREELIAMIQWWLKKGVDGFRLDVINYISKPEDFPDGDKTIGKLMEFYGVEHYFHGPDLHTYLQEIRRRAFTPFKAFSVGETPGIGFECGRLFTNEARSELDLIFNFDHLETPGHTRFDDYEYDLAYLKKYFMTAYAHLGNKDWFAVFFENHDNPRMVSKVNTDPQFHAVLAKALMMMNITLKGTPFLFQGQELGAANVPFTSITQLQDIESLNKYAALLHEGKTDAEAFSTVLAGSRDHARVPMRWTPDGGFSSGTPWLEGNGCSVSAEEQMQDAASVWSFTKELIALRHSHKELVYGDIDILFPKKKQHFVYRRALADSAVTVEINISNRSQQRLVHGMTLGLSNVARHSGPLAPYEANLWFENR